MLSDLYNKPLNKLDIKSFVPEVSHHERISEIIQRYIAWEQQDKDILFLDQQCKELVKQWAEWIILWCTELPLIMKSLQWRYELFSSSEILSEETLKYYFKT